MKKGEKNEKTQNYLKNTKTVGKQKRVIPNKNWSQK